MELDIDTKRAALKASPSVVSVVSYKGGKMMFPGSGTIIDCEEVNGTYTSTILTSTTLLRSSLESNTLQDDIKSGFGGPLINCHGEVIGVNFYDNICTPFLPVNIVSKCLRRFRENRKPCRPWLGMELTNLYTATIGKLDKVFSKFNISRGVLVKKVIMGSPAEQAGILHGDIIVQCGEKEVQSSLEFYDIIWENVRLTEEVVVLRESSAARLNLKVFVDETSPDKMNRWPVPETSKASVLIKKR